MRSLATPWRGTVDICFVGGEDTAGRTDEALDRLMDALDALEEYGIFDQGGTFGQMEEADVVPSSPLARALKKARS